MSRAEAAGDQRQITGKMAAKYDSDTECDVISWIQAMIGEELTPGMLNMHHALKSGVHLVNLAIKIRDGTANCPAKCKKMRLVPNQLSAPFKQMENIQVFLNFLEHYGVPKTGIFQTVDLYECRNMAQVLASISQLGTECQRLGFDGETIGSKPSEKVIREWTEDQLNAGQGIIGLQAGTNKFDSQKGMTSMGAVRHVADIRADKFDKKGSDTLGLQAGTNIFASQKGMTSMGAVRHVSDIRADDFDKSGSNVLGLQAGTNAYASQKGMTSMGAVRHASDIRSDDFDRSTSDVLNFQSGWNQGASQKGMRIGSVRHGADMRNDVYDPQSAGSVGQQMGTNQLASQKGMLAMGGVRHGGDLALDTGSLEGQGVLGIQMGSNKFASQSGMNPMNSLRHIADMRMEPQCQEGHGVVGLQMGYAKGANQSGMNFGMPRKI